MEQKAFRVQETCKISLECCPLVSCMLWLSGHTVKAVPVAAGDAQYDTGMDVGPHPVWEVPGVAFLLNTCHGLSIHISQFELLFAFRK